MRMANGTKLSKADMKKKGWLTLSEYARFVEVDAAGASRHSAWKKGHREMDIYVLDGEDYVSIAKVKLIHVRNFKVVHDKEKGKQVLFVPNKK